MANAKFSDFITRSRQAVRDYQACILNMRRIQDEWSSLYGGALMVESEFVGENENIIPNPTRVASLGDTIGSIGTVVSAYDGGIDVIFQKVA